MREASEKKGKKSRWFFQSLTVDQSVHKGRRVVPQSVIDAERAEGMPEELIEQEYYVSFDAPLVGSYYGDLMTAASKEGRICSIPIEPNVPVITMWDIGIADGSAIWFMQPVGRELHMIDYEYSSDVGLDYYARMLGEKAAKRGFVYGEHLAPHDMKVRELGAPDARTRLATMKSLGISMRLAPNVAVRDGINAVRQILPSIYFDAKHCEDGIEGLKQYMRVRVENQEGPDGAPIFADAPAHNWASHPADALRIGALGLRSTRQTGSRPVRPKNVGQWV
jgi:hypothetical protein